MAAYIKALKTFRKDILNRGPVEEVAPTPVQQGGLVPSAARQAAVAQTQQQAQMRYEPAQFVRNGMERFQQMREEVKTRLTEARQGNFSQSEGFGEAFRSGLAKGRTENKVKTEKNSAPLVGRPYRGLPDGPKGQEVYATNTGSGDLFSLIDKHEGGGNYSTLFGHSQRDGGQFAGTDVSGMTIGEAINFASPSGEYGQWVKGKVGRVATPMGRHQIVGSTLKAAAAEMGLSPDTPFSGEVQDRIAEHLAYKRIAGAKSPEAKRNALRSEWEGFRNVSNAALDVAIAQFEEQHMRSSKRGDTNKKGA